MLAPRACSTLPPRPAWWLGHGSADLASLSTHFRGWRRQEGHPLLTCLSSCSSPGVFCNHPSLHVFLKAVLRKPRTSATCSQHLVPASSGGRKAWRADTVPGSQDTARVLASASLCSTGLLAIGAGFSWISPGTASTGSQAAWQVFVGHWAVPALASWGFILLAGCFL